MTLEDDLMATPEGARLLEQERVIILTTELLCELMDKEKITRDDLATRLGKSKSYVTRLLDGTLKTTLRDISDVFVAIGYQFEPTAVAKEQR